MPERWSPRVYCHSGWSRSATPWISARLKFTYPTCDAGSAVRVFVPCGASATCWCHEEPAASDAGAARGRCTPVRICVGLDVPDSGELLHDLAATGADCTTLRYVPPRCSDAACLERR